MIRIMLTCCLIALTNIVTALADTTVDSADDLRQAIRESKNGDEIIIAAGRYDIADLKLRRDLTLRGEGDVVFFSSRPVAKGLLNPLLGASLTVENITFRDATSPDKNGAGIRHDGDDLTVNKCTFEDNETGILYTGGPENIVTLRDSRFLRNGFGDGYSHGVYVVRAEQVEITNSEFIGTRIGHHVKSLAKKTIITNSVFDDADGRTSYSVDASKGGDVEIRNNRFTQQANADEPSLINYDLSRGGKAIGLSITGNTITNHYARGRLLRNKSDLKPIIANNSVKNIGRGSLAIKQAPRVEQEIGHHKTVTEHIASTSLPMGEMSLEAPAPSKPKQFGLIRAPEFDREDPALVYFKLENNWRDPSAPDYLTFGQAFVEGSLQPGETLSVRYPGLLSPVQLDVKALHEDGSVRHAIVTVATPALKSGKSVEGALVKNTGTLNPSLPGSFDVVSILKEKLNAPVELTFYYADETTETVTTDSRALILDAAQQANADLWLDGSLVKSFRVEAPAIPHVTIRYDVRIYRDRDVRLSVGFINEKSFAPGRRDSVYDVRIGDAFSVDQLPHHRAANWRRVFWMGQQPQPHIIHDIETLIASNAIVPLDTSIAVDAEIIANRDARLRNLPPFSPASIERYMPMTGGRPDIGPYPQWTSHYLTAQTEAAKRVMLANANAAGAIPWHFADDETGAPVSIERRPKFWAEERGRKTQYIPDRPHQDIFASSDGGWTPDQSHRPALTAVPYLVTGDRYFADELAMQAAWSVFGRWPDLREGTLKSIDIEQVRESAWSLRDLSDAAFLLPDANPSKGYLNRVVAENLRLAKEKYIDDDAMAAAGELEGFFEEYIGREPERISPWQNDYFAISLWLSARRGDKNAEALLQWSANFHARRFIDPGFNVDFGASYQFPAKDRQSQIPVATWKELETKIRIQNPSRESLEGYPGLASGYVGSAYAALTGITSQTQSPIAFEALAVLMRKSKNYMLWVESANGGVYRNNNFIFAVTAPNGASYSRQDIKWGNKADDEGNIVIGNNGAEALSGKSANDALFGLDGDDQISAGPGNDYINGGPGNDILSGGDGSDIFAFTPLTGGTDRITDFDPAEDKIHLFTGTKLSTAEAQFQVTEQQDGTHVTFTNGGASIVLEGIDDSPGLQGAIVKF